MSTTVELIGSDITGRVIRVQDIAQVAGDYGQLVSNDIPTFEGDNSTGFWDQLNTASPFYGADDLSLYSVKIFESGVPVYIGSVQAIRANNETKTATIELRSALQTTLERGIIYVSPAIGESPAQAVASIAELYNIPIDGASFGASNATYQENEIKIGIFVISPDYTVLDLLQEIAQIGIARLYAIDGKLHMDAYENPTQSAVYDFRDARSGTLQVNIWGHPIVDNIEKDLVDGYAVEFAPFDGLPGGKAVSGTSDQQAKSIRGGNQAPVRILSLQSAIWVGESWIRYLRRPQKRITFRTSARIGKSIPPGLPVKLSYGRGGWLDLDLIVNSVDTADRIHGAIQADTQ